jgi:hypothetical protein
MISVNETENKFVLDLNNTPYNEHNIKVDSFDNNGNKLPWGVEFIDNNEVYVEKNGDNLFIKFDHTELNKKTIISLRNYNKERITIEVIPNKKALETKIYNFEITDKRITDGILNIKILSTVNNDNQPWICSYYGGPLSYNLTKHSGEGSCEISIRLLTELSSEFKSKIIFEQEKSGKEIVLILYNNKNGIEKAD